MTTILGLRLSTNKATHPLFLQRGYTGYTHSAANMLGIHGHAHIRELAYDGYFRNVDAFISATNKRKKIPTSATDCELTAKDISSFVPLPIPAITIVPIKDLSPDQLTAFMGKCRNEDPVAKKVGKTTCIVLKKPDPKRAMVYCRLSKDGIRPVENTWTPTAFASYTFLLTVVTEFLKTNTYPAFLSEDTIGNGLEAELFAHEGLGDEEKIDPAFARFLKKARVEERMSSPDDAEDEDAEMEDIEVTSYSFQNLRSAVYVAKPSPLPLTFNVGEPTEVPNLPGRAFPYFDKMLIPDNYTIRTIISAFFLRNLGDTRETQLNTFRTFRLGWEEVAKTVEGGIITHLLLGIRLALETQTRLFAIFRLGDYCGFALLGARWSVTVNNETFAAASPEELSAAVQKFSSHGFAISQVASILSKCKVIKHGIEGAEEEVKSEDLSSAINLWNAVKDRKIEKVMAEDLDKYMGMVSYTRAYKEINDRNLVWLFEQLALEERQDLPPDTPLYCPSKSYSLYNDANFQLLCTFGPNPPSLWNQAGTPFHITPPSSITDPNEELDQHGRKVLPHLLVAFKGVQAALNDLRHVLDSKEVRFDLSERAKANRCLIIGGSGRDLVYNAMRAALFSGDSKKRKGSGDGETNAAKKARTLEVTSVDDMLALLD